MTSLLISVTFGIWKICTSSTLLGAKKSCINIPCGKDPNANINCTELVAGRILFIIACVIAAMSALSFFLLALIDEKMYRRIIVTTTVKILAGLSLLMGILTISIISYHTGNIQNYLHMSMDLSAYLGMGGILVNLIGILVSLLIR